MEITPIGYILLVVAPLMMMLRPKWLYNATIFFLPFTATDLINVGTGEAASGLQASMYLGALLVFRYSVKVLLRRKITLPKKGTSALAWLGLFVATTITSLIMPLWIDGRVQVPSPYLLDFTSQPLYLTSHNITGVLYLVYGFIFAFVVAVSNQNIRGFRRSIQLFMAGSAFAALWGLMEFVCKFLGIPYPAIIFNTGTGASAQGYREVLEDGSFRLSSVAVEPSIFAQSLLIAIAIYLPYIFTQRVLFGKKIDRVLFGLLVIVLCMTTSSTGYLGLAIIFTLVLGLMTIRGILRAKHVLLFALIPVLGSLVVLSTSIFQQILTAVLFSKSESGSAL
jgi:hypothetical protein